MRFGDAPATRPVPLRGARLDRERKRIETVLT